MPITRLPHGAFRWKDNSEDQTPTHQTAQVHTLAFSTAQYDAMRTFFVALGFHADDTAPQLCPIFEQGRGCILSYGDLEFNLEESNSAAKAQFNLLLDAASGEQLANALQRYPHTLEEGLHGGFYTFRSPDGGIVTFQK